jgi:predicted site-specific integrase-resolvase
LEAATVSTRHLNQNQLAERWGISPRTLEQWRWVGQGPVHLKLGGRVVYRLQDVEHYEAQHLHANTVSPLPAQEARDAR